MEVTIESKTKVYDTYKDSGVEWLGEIPEHWEIKRFKFLAKSNKGKLPSKIVSINDDNLPPYMSMEYLRGGDENQWVKDSDALVIDKDEILLIWDGSNSGEFIKSRKGVISSTVAHIVFNNINKNFAWYHSKVLEIELRKNTIGMGIPHVNGRVLNNLTMLLPPLQEQTAIAEFLDDKTQKIDQAIGIKEQQIALLKERKQILIHKAVTRGLDDTVKLKDSGVEWIGEIPEHWEVAKIKQCSNKISKGTTPSTEGRDILVEGKVRFLKSENIFEGFITEKPLFFIDEKTDFIMKRSSLEVNDVLFVIAGASLGKVAVITQDILPANTNQAVAFVRPNEKIHPYFLSKYLVSSTINELTWLEAVQSAQPNLSMESLGNFPITLPPLSEQKEISDYIETASQKIETAISLKQQEIEKLKEYKGSLINGVVTGKLKVS